MRTFAWVRILVRVKVRELTDPDIVSKLFFAEEDRAFKGAKSAIFKGNCVTNHCFSVFEGLINGNK